MTPLKPYMKISGAGLHEDALFNIVNRAWDSFDETFRFGEPNTVSQLERLCFTVKVWQDNETNA